MKQTWIYGPRPPANTKKSNLGFPSLTGSAKPPLPGAPKIEYKPLSCDDCGAKALLFKVTLPPNPNQN